MGSRVSTTLNGEDYFDPENTRFFNLVFCIFSLILRGGARGGVECTLHHLTQYYHCAIWRMPHRASYASYPT